MDLAKRTRICTAVNKTVPKQHCQKIIDAIMEWAHIISDGPIDLGRSDMVVHNIHLRDKDLIKFMVRDWLKIGLVEQTKSLYNSSIFCVQKYMAVVYRWFLTTVR